MTSIHELSLRLGIAASLVCAAGPAGSQNYPAKPIRLFTSAVGGGADFAARIVAQELTTAYGQPVVVENRGGAGFVAAEIVAKAPPDGYTLLVYGPPFWIGPLMQKAAYDPVRDFMPVVLAISSPNILAVHPSLPVKSVRELIALAKSRPGTLNYASGQSGSSNHLAAELFKAMAGVDIVRVTYKSGGSSINDLIAGQVQLSFSSVAIVGPHVKAGRLRGLAVTSAQPSALAPGMPTVAASGLPGYQSVSTLGVFAPIKTPMAIVNQLSLEITRALQQPESRGRLFKSGAEVVGSTPEQSLAEIKADIGRLGKVIRDADIRGE